MIELKFLRELLLIKQMNIKSVIFVAIGIFLDKALWFPTYVCSGCHYLLMVSIGLDDIVIYLCIIR